MRGPDALKKAEDNWHTDMGALFNGERVVFRGKDLFTELGELSWFKYLMFGITGKKFSDSQISLIEKIWTLSVSYPEPRIWNNRIASLTGSARSTGSLGVSAGIAASEASIYGNQINIVAIDFIRRANKLKNAEQNLEEFVIKEIKKNRIIPGYGRPIIKTDERIKPLTDAAKKLNLAEGPHYLTALAVEKILIESKYRMVMNASGLAAALMADLGFNNRDHYYCSILAFSAGIIPCYIDSAGQKEGGFFPLACGRLNYTGAATRHW